MSSFRRKNDSFYVILKLLSNHVLPLWACLRCSTNTGPKDGYKCSRMHHYMLSALAANIRLRPINTIGVLSLLGDLMLRLISAWCNHRAYVLQCKCTGRLEKANKMSVQGMFRFESTWVATQPIHSFIIGLEIFIPCELQLLLHHDLKNKNIDHLLANLAKFEVNSNFYSQK